MSVCISRSKDYCYFIEILFKLFIYMYNCIHGSRYKIYFKLWVVVRKIKRLRNAYFLNEVHSRFLLIVYGKSDE